MPSVVSGGVGSVSVGPIQSVTIELATADILTLDTIPVEIVPGETNKALRPTGYLLQFIAGDTPFLAMTLQVKTEDLGDEAAIIETGQINVSTDIISWGDADPQDAISVEQIAGKGLVVFTEAPTGPTTGIILTSSKDAGGSNYQVGDTGFLDGGGVSAYYEVDTVDGGGAVLTYHLTNSGTGYTEANFETIADGSQPGIGTGFTVDVDSITSLNGDGSASLTVFYSVVDLA
jgi:hypothetical protein